MLENKQPNIECVELSSDNSYGRFTVEPLERGYGTTLGNSLRRVLLSSLEGCAVTSLRVEGVYHEFSTIPGVIEDMTEIILNVKSIRAKIRNNDIKTVYINCDAGQTGVVTAGDIVCDDEVEIVNPDLKICTLNGDGKLFMEMTLCRGVGYNSAEENKWPEQLIGVIPIDSIFNPVRKVNYYVENTRVGQVTNFDKLTLEVWTDGTVEANKAVQFAANHLIDQLQIFVDLERRSEVEEVVEAEVMAEPINKMGETLIEDVDFSVRTYNCLKRANINTVQDLINKSQDDMMKVRNLGKKSLEEVIVKLHDMGLSLAPSLEPKRDADEA